MYIFENLVVAWGHATTLYSKKSRDNKKTKRGVSFFYLHKIARCTVKKVVCVKIVQFLWCICLIDYKRTKILFTVPVVNGLQMLRKFLP